MGKLEINRGTTFTISILYKKDNVAATLVGAVVRFTMKPVEYDDDTDDSAASVLKNVSDGTAEGTASIVIDPADTATLAPQTYHYDIKVEESGGDIYKIDEGTVELDGSPTNRMD